MSQEFKAWFTVDELNAWAEKKLKENPQWAEQPAQDVVTNLTPTYAFFQPPKPVGAWVLDPGGVVHTQFVMHSKPTDEQIKNTEAMFGWKWKDLT